MDSLPDAPLICAKPWLLAVRFKTDPGTLVVYPLLVRLVYPCPGSQGCSRLDT